MWRNFESSWTGRGRKVITLVPTPDTYPSLPWQDIPPPPPPTLPLDSRAGCPAPTPVPCALYRASTFRWWWITPVLTSNISPFCHQSTLCSPTTLQFNYDLSRVFLLLPSSVDGLWSARGVEAARRGQLVENAAWTPGCTADTCIPTPTWGPLLVGEDVMTALCEWWPPHTAHPSGSPRLGGCGGGSLKWLPCHWLLPDSPDRSYCWRDI